MTCIRSETAHTNFTKIIVLKYTKEVENYSIFKPVIAILKG